MKAIKVCKYVTCNPVTMDYVQCEVEYQTELDDRH